MIEVVDSVIAVRRQVAAARQHGKSIGLVPTMGALHEGHASLIRVARQETGFVVVSIFVNPLQFGPNEDLDRYPRNQEADLAVCTREGVDLVFAPRPETLYPAGFCTYVEVKGLQDVLCGRSRPGHFRGVVTVVLKLFHIVQPNRAYFGQKDAQQTRIIEQMVGDLDLSVRIRVCPIVREPDGLALSSRNRYLNAEERRSATVLYRTLNEVRRRIEEGEEDAVSLRRLMSDSINQTRGAVLDYAEIVHAETLQPVQRVNGPVLLALAVRFRDTRLIDNITVNSGTGRNAKEEGQANV
jgi:pantoate--beta-alanine ligase